jgi:hypothetical protein
MPLIGLLLPYHHTWQFVNVLGLEEKINTFAQGMGTLETRLTTAQQRASEAETKGKYKPE